MKSARDEGALLFSPFDVPGVEVVDSGNDSDFLGMFIEIGFLVNLRGGKTCVLGRGVNHNVARLAFCQYDRRLDVADQGLYVTRGSVTSDGSGDSTAALMAENDDEPRAEMRDRILNAAQNMLVQDVT